MISKLALLFSPDEPQTPKPFLIEVEGMVERVLSSRSSEESLPHTAAPAAQTDRSSSGVWNSARVREWLASVRVQRQAEWNQRIVESGPNQRLCD